MFDPVPWFVGGGAQHSPEVARLFAYAATSGAEGVVTPGDLKVTPLDVAGSSVRALAGACIINSDAAGGLNQSYIGRNVGQDVIAIQPTGSGSGRSDLIVARIEDPFMAGEPWSNPADVTKGPYIFTRVIPNVSPTTTTAPAGSSAIALARIDIPANTGTITAGMIKDLRQLARPRELNVHAAIDGLNIDHYHQAPPNNFRQFSPFVPQFDVPKWATHVTVKVTLSQIINYSGETVGSFNVRVGGASGTTPVFGPPILWDEKEVATTDGIRHTYIVPAIDLDIRSMANTRQPFALWADTQSGYISMRTWGQMLVEVTFHEKVV